MYTLGITASAGGYLSREKGGHSERSGTIRQKTPSSEEGFVTIYFKVVQEFSDAHNWCRTTLTLTQPHDLSG